MIIQIDEKQRVRGTEQCWQLERLRIAQSGKKQGEEIWLAEKYYSTLGTALSEALQREIRTHPAIEVAAAIEAAKQIVAKYTAIFDQKVNNDS